MSKQKLHSPPCSCLTDATDAFMHPIGDTSITLAAPAACASLSKFKGTRAGCSRHARRWGSGWHCRLACWSQT